MDLWLIHLSEPKIDQLDEAVYAYIYILLLVTVMESHSSVSQSVCLSSFICLSVCLSVYLHARGSAGQSFTSVAPATKSLSAELWEVREGCVVEVVATKKFSLLLRGVRKLRYSIFFFFPATKRPFAAEKCEKVALLDLFQPHTKMSVCRREVWEGCVVQVFQPQKVQCSSKRLCKTL